MQNIIVKKIEKEFKTDVRKLEIYYDSNIVCIAVSYCGYFAFSLCPPDDKFEECRKLCFQNLYWLIGNECSYKSWSDKLNQMRKDDAFNDDEHNIALASYNLKRN